MYNKAVFSLICVFFLLTIVPVFAQPETEESEVISVVNSFFNWYIDYIQADAEGNVNNPRIDGVYRDSEYLTSHFIGFIDSLADTYIGYDIFTCSQTFFHRLEPQMMAVSDNQATVMLKFYYGDNPHSDNNTAILVREDGQWKIDSIVCGENFTPAGVVESFYHWYLAYSQPDEGGNFRNPLVDGVYRDYPYLAPDLVANIDNQLANRELGGGDPFLCAQDRPGGVSVNTVNVEVDTATVMVHEYFTGNSSIHNLLVELTGSENDWLISDVVCDVTPEAVALVFFNEYVTYARFDVENGIERTPILDWGFRWQDYLSTELLVSVIDTSVSDEPFPADPILCAQDFPVQLSAETSVISETLVVVFISGVYPSGPDTYTSYPLVEVDVMLIDGQWRMVDLRCATV